MDEDGKNRVQFLMMFDGKRFTEIVKDISDVQFEDIIAKLEAPEKNTDGNNMFIEFSVNIDVFEKRYWQEWVDKSIFQHHDGSGRPRATADEEDRLIIISVVTAPDSSLSTIRHENARPHVTRVAMNCLTACQTLPLPTRSPDLSSIEHVWDMKRRQLHLPRDVNDLAH
ncbi:hypothetical protein TNCV_2177511 [Trichonephila clavipes]|uniref:Uncharacterized protein n=1 Tax=Trichonephila clavipes TaxID=2585209 RepID=A0A8X6VU62_TRICX|nr:hypothetical protein TNCV_2177511 [Trichonephila clavipes]